MAIPPWRDYTTNKPGSIHLKSDSNSVAGNYTFSVDYGINCDSDFVCVAYANDAFTFNVEVLPRPLTPPAFAERLKLVEVELESQVVYKLPSYEYYDYENADTTYVEVTDPSVDDQEDSFIWSFTTFDPGNKELTFAPTIPIDDETT